MGKYVNHVRGLKIHLSQQNLLLHKSLRKLRGLPSSNGVKYKIGFDFDGVIIDHTMSKIKKAKEFGLDIKPHQTPSNRLKKIMDRKYYRQMQKYIYGSGTPEAPIVKGAGSALSLLKGFGHEMFIISRRGHEFHVPALKWLEKNLPGVFDLQKALFVEKDEGKDGLCQKFNIQVYIDDKVSVLEKIKSVDKKFLFDPYNIRDDFDLDDIRPVSSWDEFLKQIF